MWPQTPIAQGRYNRYLFRKKLERCALNELESRNTQSKHNKNSPSGARHFAIACKHTHNQINHLLLSPAKSLAGNIIGSQQFGAPRVAKSPQNGSQKNVPPHRLPIKENKNTSQNTCFHRNNRCKLATSPILSLDWVWFIRIDYEHKFEYVSPGSHNNVPVGGWCTSKWGRERERERTYMHDLKAMSGFLCLPARLTRGKGESILSPFGIWGPPSLPHWGGA